MYQLESGEYAEVVEKLVDEYADLFDDEQSQSEAVAHDIAEGVVAGATIQAGKPTVYHAASVYGEAVTATDNESLSPYQIIQYTNQTLPNRNPGESARKTAIVCLTNDLLTEAEG